MCKVSELTQSLMEVNPDNCGQPTVSDILGALPLCSHPPSLTSPLEGIMSPVGSFHAKIPLCSLSGDLPTTDSRVIGTEDSGWEGAMNLLLEGIKQAE